jgi:hypothetical protein
MVLPRPILAAAAAVAVTAGCTPYAAPPPGAPSERVIVETAPEWQNTARPADLDRLARIDAAWSEGLAEARRRHRRAVAAEGELLDPRAALARPDPSPGSYRCRVVSLGTHGRGPAFTAYRPFFCYVEVEGDNLTIVKQTGSQRPAGYLYPDPGRNRLVFLGSLAPGGGEAPLAYGEDPVRDLAGVLERVSPFRYRLVIPWPQSDSKLDVIELVPLPE